jgi:hypothetical protein
VIHRETLERSTAIEINKDEKGARGKEEAVVEFRSCLFFGIRPNDQLNPLTKMIVDRMDRLLDKRGES